jgi:hypothetical protein
MTEELRQILEGVFESEPGEVNTEKDLSKFLYIYKKMEDEVKQLELLKEAELEMVEEHHDSRIAAKRKAQKWISDKMEAYTRAAGTNFNFANGRVGTRKTPTVTWHKEGGDLIEFVKVFNVPNGIIEKTTFKPNKKAIKEWALGPDGNGESYAFTIDKSPKFYINLPKEDESV